MLPDELFKRRHYGTPQSTLLIITNYVVFGIAASIFASSHAINWFFWVVMAVLALHNFNNIRKDREEYTRVRIIAYVGSVILLGVMLLIIRFKA